MFYPQWNLAFDDADFYQCTPEHDIESRSPLAVFPMNFGTLPHTDTGCAVGTWRRFATTTSPAMDLKTHFVSA